MYVHPLDSYKIENELIKMFIREDEFILCGIIDNPQLCSEYCELYTTYIST